MLLFTIVIINLHVADLSTRSSVTVDGEGGFGQQVRTMVRSGRGTRDETWRMGNGEWHVKQRVARQTMMNGVTSNAAARDISYPPSPPSLRSHHTITESRRQAPRWKGTFEMLCFLFLPSPNAGLSRTLYTNQIETRKR